MLKLPKEIVADPNHEAVVKRLTTNLGTLWEKGANQVPTFKLTPRLATELGHALAAGLASQGLELIEKELAREQKGLDALAAKTPASPQQARISRVLFMADDGSERFYRECDSLLTRYASRLIGCRLAVPGEELGETLAGQPKLIRALLVTDKKAAGRILLSLV